MSKNPIKVALIGNPNVGKTSVFNQLTGTRQKVGNYAGVTVERKVGFFQLPSGNQVRVLDLPGTYSLDATSPDEAVTRDVCLGKIKDESQQDAFLCVVDATNLKLHLGLVLEMIELGRPILLVLNMMDEARRRGMQINTQKLSERLGVPVVETVAVRDSGIQNLMHALDQGKFAVPQTELTGLTGSQHQRIQTILHDVVQFVDEEDKQDAIVIELYAKQFGWEARYAGDDKTLGKANVRLIEGINTLGVDLADPAAQDDKVVTELHLPVGKKVIFKMRSQDVLHSAYMPHFRAQMNCVPGMITQFSFTPTVTTADMRTDAAIVAKVDKINKIRTKNSAKIVAEGGTALDPYTFDYLLLCNKICGSSHYNMQMKIVVDTPEEFKTWLSDKPTLAQQWKEANAPKPVETAVAPAVDSTKVVAQVIK